ncbi:MAG: ATP-binding protein [Bacteroidota bacterium]
MKNRSGSYSNVIYLVLTYLCISVPMQSLLCQPKNPIFYRLSSDYSLISNKTTCTVEDYMGYIWIGSEEGLSRYNGYGSKNYTATAADSTTLYHDYIKALHVDSDKNLWVGTFSGLCRYNFSKDRFERLGDRFDQLKDQSINAIAEYEGIVWFGTDEKLVGLNIEKWQVTNVFQPKDKDGYALKINVLHSDKTGLKIGTPQGLFFLEGEKMLKERSLGDIHVSAITSENNRLYIGTKNSGLIISGFHGENQVINMTNTVNMVSDQINDLKILTDSALWVATNAGINTFDRSTMQVTRKYEHEFDNWIGISDPVIRSIYQDKNECVWFTTQLSGVNFFHKSDNLFEYYTQRTKKANDNELLDFAVLSMRADEQLQKLWIGSRKGLSLYSPDKSQFSHFPFDNGKAYNNQILSISEMIDNQLWLGTEKGLVIWNQQTEKFIHESKFQLNDRINVVFKDRQNQVWLGTKESGLLRVDRRNNELKSISGTPIDGNSKFKLKSITDIVQKPDGSIWVGTESGLFEVKREGLRLFQPNNKKFNPWINDLSIASSGNLLISTKLSGVLRIDSLQNVDTLVNKNRGLRSDNISTLINNGRDSEWWVSTDKGLSKLLIADDSVLSVENFDVLDGLQGKQFTPRAGAMTGNQIFFGGLSGLTSFDPRNIELPNYKLQIVIDKLTVDGAIVTPDDETGLLSKVVGLTDQVSLKPENESFSIFYKGIDYVRPDSLIYQYKLENYDNRWKTSRSGMVSYTNLERGKTYIFKVKAKSRMRQWSDEKVLKIYLIPYFYETAWFKILLSLFILALIAFVIYIRELRIKGRQQKLEKIIRLRTRELERQIQEKEETARALEVVAEEAKKADKAKSEFLAKISHEMRTPLNGIMGLAQMAKDQAEEEEKNELLDLVYRSSESLKGIINDLLDFGKMEFEKLKIYEEDLDIRKLLRDLMNSFGPQVRQKGIKLHCELDDQIPNRLLGDLLRIRQVLVNLISNAIKFTEEGHVKVTLRQITLASDFSTIKFQVEDTGIGIPEANRKQIFSSFEQIENGLSRKYGGTGLGLAISQRLVSLMGGEIKVDEAKGGGSEFTFELKLRIDKSTKSLVTSKVNGTLTINNRILLVEDNPTNILVATKMLKKAKQKVETATNGKEAVELLENQEFDLILMDVQMPIMDGFEATQQIRKSGTPYADIPIVALSAGVMKEDIQRCYDIGMNGFLSKPVNYKELVETLYRYLND